jgi:hypothetical protein
MEMAVFIVGIMTVGWLVNNWIRAKHGYPLEDEWGGKTDKGLPDAERKVALLTSENEQLRAELSSIKDRLVSVEKIVVDDTHRLTAEIEALRGPTN